MPVSDPTGTTIVELSRAEQWVVHHVLLNSLGLADGEQSRSVEPIDLSGPRIGIIEKLEAGSFEFTPEELQFIQQACSDHARSTGATADRNLATSVVDRIDSVTEDGTVDRERSRVDRLERTE